MEQFEVGALKFIFIIYENTYIELSFTSLSFFLCVLIIFFFTLFSLVYRGKLNNVLSNPLQKIIEKLILLVALTLKDNLKKEDVNYLGFILSILFFILGSNVIGVFPYTFALTGHLYITFSIAFCIFLGLNVIGFMTHGSVMLSLLLPQGISFIISSLLILIEFISYNFRVISLSVRLFANIMAGHTLLMVVYSFNFFLVSKASNSLLITILPLFVLPSILLVLALIGLEFGVALIQAYVFTLLSIMYLYDAKYLH